MESNKHVTSRSILFVYSLVLISIALYLFVGIFMEDPVLNSLPLPGR